jgi:hypothetical protein
MAAKAPKTLTSKTRLNSASSLQEANTAEPVETTLHGVFDLQLGIMGTHIEK